MPGILIVDDMPLIRSTLVRILAQHEELFAPVLEATNGDEAVAISRAHEPNVVLMDIKMPGLTGLQALEVIRRERPGTKVVMLTAYNEFAYVQKALKLGAHDYILKPVRPERLLELLQEIKLEIEEEHREQRTVGMVKDSLQKTLPVIETNLVETLIRDPSPEGTAVEESLAYLGKRLTWPAVLVAKVDDFEQFAHGRQPEELQRLFAEAVKLARAEMPEPHAALVGYSRPGRIIAIISTQKTPATAEQLRDLANQLRAAIAAQLPFTVTIGLGKRHMGLESIPLSYAEANLARRYHGRAAGDHVVALDDAPPKTPDAEEDSSRYLVQMERGLARSVESRQWAEAQQLIQEITEVLAERHFNHPEAMKNHCAELTTLVTWGVIRAGAEEARALDVLHQQVRALSSWKTVPEVRSWTFNSLAEMIALVPTDLPRQSAVQAAVSYIHQNYQRSELSLGEVAEAVALSPSHFSAQFKAKTDMTYVQFVTAVRIEEAGKLLLSTDHSVNTIAEMVGYPNATNFYRHFRRQTGTTPGAYRETNRHWQPA